MINALDPVATGLVAALAAGGMIAGVKWLLAGKAKQIDAIPDSLHRLEMAVALLTGRLERAETEIANDKAGRQAFAQAQQQLARIDATLTHITQLMEDYRATTRDLWTAVNKLRDAA